MTPRNHRAGCDTSLSSHPSCSPILEQLEPRLLLDGMTAEQGIELFHTTAAVFIENQGQWADESIRFVHKGQGANIAHTDSGPIFELFREVASDEAPEVPDEMRPDMLNTEPAEMERLRFSAAFDGANTVTPVGIGQAETRFNFLLGKEAQWRRNVPSYEIVAYEGLYDGIDLHTWGQRDSLKYEFHVDPGTDFSQISVSYSGIDGLRIDEAGALHVRLPGDWGEVVDDTPYIYQVVDGDQIEVAGRYRLVDGDTYAFEITGGYDPARRLIIDPVLAWSADLDHGSSQSVATDLYGNILIACFTSDVGRADGGYDENYNGGSRDGFVAKLSPGGEHIWSTYLGGAGDDRAHGVATDSLGNIVVTGSTESSGWTSGGLDTSFNGDWDHFVVKLDASGGHVWSTYLGGAGQEYPCTAAVDSVGNVYVTGSTESPRWTSGVFGATFDIPQGAFLAKLTPSGLPVWLKQIGTGGGSAYDVAVDAADDVFVAGATSHGGWVSGGYDITHGGVRDGFVIKMDPAGQDLWSTYIGGSYYDETCGIAIGSTGEVFVSGRTGTPDWVSGGYDETFNGGPGWQWLPYGWDGYVVKLSPHGQHRWSTYIGGTENDYAWSIAATQSGCVAVGSTSSNDWAYHGFDPSLTGSSFAVELSSAGDHLWSNYISGGTGQYSDPVAIDAFGDILVSFSQSVAKITNGSVMLRKAGIAVTDWESSGASGRATDSAWSDEGGMVLDPGLLSATEAQPVYRFNLPEEIGAWQITGISVSLYGRGGDWAWEPEVWVGPNGSRYQLTGGLPETEGWSHFEVPAGQLSSLLVDAGPVMPGCTFDVMLDLGLLDWYDLKEACVRYSYEGVLLPDLQSYQLILDTAASMLSFYEEIASDWPAPLLGQGELSTTLQKMIPTLQSLLGVDDLMDAILEGLSLISDFELLIDTLGGVFTWIDFMTSVDVYPGTVTNSAFQRLVNLADSWRVALEDDGQITGSEANTVNGVIQDAQAWLISLEGEVNAVAADMRGLLSDPDPGVANYASLGLGAIGPILRFDPETGDGPLENSYLPALRQQLTELTLNLAPTDIYLSNDSPPESTPVGGVVGTFSTTDPYDLGSHTYEFVAGSGDDDNSRFSIVGNVLKTAVPLNYEGQATFVIRVSSTDQGGLSTEKNFTIDVTDVNEEPSGIGLSNNSIPENQPPNTVVGTFSTTDPDIGNTFTYILVSGGGSGDNGSFSIVGNTLRTAASFNYETKNSYSIRVRTTDQGGLPYEDAFTINVTNVNEQPTNIALLNNTVAENQPAGTVVGSFSTTDPDSGDTFTYTLVGGSGGVDNSSFSISGNQLKTAESFDFQTKSAYSILVRSTDAGGLWVEDAFTVTVDPVDPAPWIVSWGSAADHGTLGELVLAIPDDGTFSDSRNGGIQTLLVEFSEAINVGSFTSESVHIAGIDINGNDVALSGIDINTSTRDGDTIGVIEFSDTLPDAARYIVRVEGVTDVAGNPLIDDNDRIMTALIGDAWGDLRVNNTDLGAVRFMRDNGPDPLDPTDANAVRTDVWTDGSVNNTDFGGVRFMRDSGHDARFIPDPVFPVSSEGASVLLTAEGSGSVAPSQAPIPELVVQPSMPDTDTPSSVLKESSVSVVPVLGYDSDAQIAGADLVTASIFHDREIPVERLLDQPDQTGETQASLDTELDAGLVDVLAESEAVISIPL